MNRDGELRKLFDLGLTLKLALGALELLGALLVLLVPRTLVVWVAEFATQGELANDPGDAVALHLRELAHSYAVHAHYFVALYLFLRGFVKVVLVGLVLRGYNVAYPLFIVALIFFSVYETYRGLSTANLVLLALAAFDFGMIVLTAHFYRERLAAALPPLS